MGDRDEARAKVEREKLEGQPLTLSKSYINNFDGDYQYVDQANGKPHWKSDSGMHLYWGPRQMWLLRSRFTPDNPTASAFCDEEDIFMGDNDFQWSTTTSWVASVLRIEPGPPEEELAPQTLRFANCLVSKFDGDYELKGQANGRPHWECDDGTAGGLHLYWGPQGLWLLRSVFDSDSKSCSAYCSCSDTPAGTNLWHWMRGGDWHPQELNLTPGQGSSIEKVQVDHTARQQLPTGWREELDEKGEAYFVNEYTEATTWVRPKLPATRDGPDAEDSDEDSDQELPAVDDGGGGGDDYGDDDDGAAAADEGEEVEEEEEQGEVPDGWTAAVSSSTGDTYYINNINDERTWDFPTETAAESAAKTLEAGLPKGWKCKVSGTTGETYYFNSESGETTWETPQDPDSDPLKEIFDHADMGSKGHLDREDVNALIRAMGYEVREEYVDGVLQLYGDDDDGGRAGIVFGQNFKLLWEHLGGKMDGSMTTIGAGGKDGDDGKTEAPEGLQKRKLPDGWETAVSHDTGEIYYVNTSTGESQFTFPEEQQAAEELPPGWESMSSRTTGGKYYLNTKTGETQFDPPTEAARGADGSIATEDGMDDGMIAAPSLDAPPAIGGVDDSGGGGGGGGGAALPPRDLPQGWETARSKNTGKVYYINIWTRESQYEFPAIPALPAGWTMAISTSTGEPYFVNSVSGETQFEFPDGPAEGAEEPVAPPAPAAPASEAAKGKPLPAGWDIATSRTNNQKFYVNMVTGESQAEFPAQPALPDGWDMATSQQTGRVYYVNSVTGEISFDLHALQAQLMEEQYLLQQLAEEEASMKIQAVWRGHTTRNLLMEEISEELQAEQREKSRKKQRMAFLKSTESVPPPMMSSRPAVPGRPVPVPGGGGGAKPATPTRRPPSKPGRSPPSVPGQKPRRPAPRAPGSSGKPRKPPPRAPPKKPPPRAPPKKPPARRPPPSPGGGGGSPSVPSRKAPTRPSPAKPSRAPPSIAAPSIGGTPAAPTRRPPSKPT
jgi:hypothetical protein